MTDVTAIPGQPLRFSQNINGIQLDGSVLVGIQDSLLDF